MTIAVIACGALASHCRDIARRHNLDIHIEAINPLLHNQPQYIADEVEKVLPRLKATFDQVVIGYADCGTYGALDDVCQRHGVQRLDGNHCYDVFATAEALRQEFESEPGTFILTDYLVRTFQLSVTKELGMDRYPELNSVYFGNYTRLLWLAQKPTDELQTWAQNIALQLGLSLEVHEVGDVHLERQLMQLIGSEM